MKKTKTKIEYAEEGDAEDQFSMGWAFFEGDDGHEKDDEKAFYWFKLAADNNNNAELANLGLAAIYKTGSSFVEKDENMSNVYFERAMAITKIRHAEDLKILLPLAKQGDADAQFAMAHICEFGLGVDKNIEESFKWEEKSAIQGHANAQDSLASRYLSNDKGVKQDYVKAKYWLKQAHKNGHPDAKYIISLVNDWIAHPPVCCKM